MSAGVGEAPTATETVTVNGAIEEARAQEVVQRRPDRTPLSRRDPVALAQHFFQSGYFNDVKSMSQAVVKIVAGEELGFGPMTSMRGIHIIDGGPSLSASLIGALVKRSADYNYRRIVADGEHSEIEFFERGVSLGTVEFTFEEAAKKRAKENGTWMALTETRRWKESLPDMLFARCLTRGVRQHCPDVMAGMPAYVPEELGAEVDAQGEVVSVPAGPEPVDAQVVEETPAVDQPAHVALLKHLINLAAPSLQELGINILDGVNAILGTLDLGSKMIDLGKLDEGLAALTEDEAASLAEELQGCIVHQVEEFNASIQDRTEHLGKAGAEGNWHDGFNVLLGSIGLDAIPPSEDFAQALAAFTPEQRQAIEEELEKLELNAPEENGGDDASA